MSNGPSDKITNIISSLEKINDEKKVKFKLPSSKLEVTLKPLRAKHISRINSSFVAGSSDGSYASSFVSLMKELFTEILELPLGKTYYDFDFIDYHYILLKIRESLNPKLRIVTDNEVLFIDIIDHIKLFDEKKTYKKHLEFGEKSFKVTVSLPNFERFSKYNKLISLSQKTARESKQPNMAKFTNEIFAFSLLMYLDKLKLIIDGEMVEFIFAEESPSVQMQILDLIPKNEYKKIYSSISKIIEPVNKILEIEGSDSSIPIDHTLLIDDIEE